MIKNFQILLLFVLFSSSQAQNSDWQSLTNMNEIKDIAIYQNKLVVASNGGSYIYDPNDNSIKKITNIEGLGSVDLAAVETDNYGNIIFAGSNGSMQAYRAAEESWQDIRFDGSNINDITIVGDTLWLASDDGAAVFLYRNNKWEYNDFFLNFPVVIGSIKTIELYNSRVWLATDIGLLSAPSDFSNITLTDAQNWILQTVQNGLPANNILSFEIFQDNLYIGTSNGLAFQNSSGEITNIIAVTYPANSLLEHNGNLHIASNKTHYYYNGSESIFITSFIFNITSFVVLQDSFWFGIFSRGLRNDQNENLVSIQGPVKNHVRFILKDNKSRIWASTGRFKLTPNEGFSVFENGSWTGYDFSGIGWSDLGNTDYLYQDRFENVWIGSWGGGIHVVTPTGERYFHNHSRSGFKIISTVDSVYNSPLEPINEEYKHYFNAVNNGLEDYVVITAFKEDLQGNLWIANSHAANRLYFAVAPYNGNFLDLNPASWSYFGEADGLALSEKTVTSIEFDIFGRLWVGTTNDGVFVLDYNNTLANKSDDQVFLINDDDGLNSNSINSLASGTDGVMWIATAAGLNSFDGNNIYNHNGDPDGVNGPIFSSSVRINYVVVDRYNNKWIATNDGLTILKSGNTGFEPGSWKSYTSANSGLLDNMIHCISLNQNNSEVLLGTESGISIFRGSFAEIKNDFKKVMAGPNPFNLSAPFKFIIKNLKANSSVKIFNLNGILIKKLSPKDGFVEGGRATWDGKDSNGNKVASGIYFYSAYTEDGKAFSGKIAVIKH